MGNNTIGFSESRVNNTIGEFNADSAKVLETLTDEFNKTLKQIADNWGTEEGKTWVTDTLITSLNKTGEEVSNALVEIGKVIKTTAEKQAADTNNTVSINPPTKAQLGGLNNQMQNVLDNGFVGVYSTLQADVTRAQESLIDNVNKRLTKLKTNAVDNCKDSFTNEGTSNVAATAETFIEQINESIVACFNQLKQGIDENTASATTYARNIQEAGLRG